MRINLIRFIAGVGPSLWRRAPVSPTPSPPEARRQQSRFQSHPKHWRGSGGSRWAPLRDPEPDRDGRFVRVRTNGMLDTNPFGIGTNELERERGDHRVTNGACSDWAFRVDDIPEDGRVLGTYSAPDAMSMPASHGTSPGCRRFRRRPRRSLNPSPSMMPRRAQHWRVEGSGSAKAPATSPASPRTAGTRSTTAACSVSTPMTSDATRSTTTHSSCRLMAPGGMSRPAPP